MIVGFHLPKLKWHVSFTGSLPPDKAPYAAPCNLKAGVTNTQRRNWSTFWMETGELASAFTLIYLKSLCLSFDYNELVVDYKLHSIYYKSK